MSRRGSGATRRCACEMAISDTDLSTLDRYSLTSPTGQLCTVTTVGAVRCDGGDRADRGVVVHDVEMLLGQQLVDLGDVDELRHRLEQARDTAAPGWC